MISRCFRFFLFLPLLLLVTVPALARQTPEAVLKEIQTAIDASDLAAFERRVDCLLYTSSCGQIIADPCEAGHPHSITEICSLQACGKPSAPARGRCGDIGGNEP